MKDKQKLKLRLNIILCNYSLLYNLLRYVLPYEQMVQWNKVHKEIIKTLQPILTPKASPN